MMHLSRSLLLTFSLLIAIPAFAETEMDQKAMSTKELSALEHNKQLQHMAAAHTKATEIIVISPDKRAEDYKAAFDHLKSTSQGHKIVFTLKKGKLTNITDVSILPGKTMLNFTLNTTKGVVHRIVPIEDIQSVEA